jgi:hypothetical protein
VSSTQNTAKRISELSLQLEGHRATTALLNWQALSRVFRGYLANSVDLLELIDAPHNNPELALRMFDEDGDILDREGYLDELFRFLHNYLSLLSTLIDHTRVLARNYQRTDFDLAYQNRVALLTQMPVASFLKNLRNYLVHYRIAPMTINMSVNQEEPNFAFRVTLNPEKLLQWKDWSQTSKSYIRSKDTIILRDCVDEYTQHIHRLYDWMFSQFRVLHAADLADGEVIRTELLALMAKQWQGYR